MKRTAVGCIVLLAAYVVVSLFNDPRGTLGTDTGGKVATLRAMEQHGDFDPDVGYWAERWDPDGDLHPLYYTFRSGDRWVNVTTLPVLYLGYPLYRVGGYRLLLLIPMVGSVLAALAAQALARRLGSACRLTFWVVGLATPLTLYALDFWEHSLGVGLMTWAVVVLSDVLAAARRWPRALAAGLLIGAAATLRTEALVYGALATAAVCLLVLWRERHLVAPVVVGVAVASALAAVLLANAALERATVGESVRTERAAGAAEGGGDTAAERLREGLVTTVGLEPSLSWGSAAVGGCAVLLLVYGCRRAGRAGGRGPATIAAVGAGGIYVARFAQGLGFVPGMAAASPIGAVAAVPHDRAPEQRVRRRLLVTIALAALPVVWTFQFRGGAPAQWGGRYVLVSGLLLTVVGLTALEHATPLVRRTGLAFSAAVTVFGLVWMASRTQEVANAGVALQRRPETVMVSRVAHLARELGAFYRYGGQPWLTAVTDVQERAAVDVVRRTDAQTFALIDTRTGRPPAFAGFALRGSERMDFLGVRLRITAFERTP
jgi:hypothetical protein